MGLTGPNSGHQPGLLISPGVSRGVSIFVPFPARDHLLSLARGHFPIFKAINVGPTPHLVFLVGTSTSGGVFWGVCGLIMILGSLSANGWGCVPV